MSSLSQPLAIIGISCRVPGANGPDEYWELIRSARDATGELPEEILDRELYFDPEKGVLGKSYSFMGGLVDRLPFDNTKCRLPEGILGDYDPAHLTTCEVASDALRDAKLDPFNLPTKNVGVYIGHTGGTNKAGDVVFAIYIEQVANYLMDLDSLAHLPVEQRRAVVDQLIEEVRRENDHRDSNAELKLDSSTGAQLISRAFGLEGPSMVIDAACASSMQALALASRALQQGHIDMAVVGGASVCKKESLILFSAAQSVTNSRSRPFDEDASGLVTSEGYVNVIVKTLEAAVRDGDPVRCVVRGIGMSADGKGKSLWAPLKTGQKLAVQRAYEKCQFTPAEIQYVEAHATSTQVGDATELSALADTFPQPEPGQEKIPIGSVKANVGHTLETAGMAGMVKTILAMEHETFPPCANLENPNKNVAWDELPFRLPNAPQPWPRRTEGETRKAAVNAFGIGGLNVHVVLEEYDASKPLEHYGVKGSPQSRLKSEPLEPIAVIGIGTILPGAESPEEFWQLLKSGQDPKRDAPKDRWNVQHYCSSSPQKYRSIGARGGFITDYQYDWRSHKVPPKQVANANPLQFQLLDAADRALKNSGYYGDKLPRERIGVVVGSIFGGEFANQLQVGLRLPELAQKLRRLFATNGIALSNVEEVLSEFDKQVLKDMPALIDETGSFTSSTLASRITKTFNLKGGALSLDGSLPTGMAALSVCLDTLRSTDCDMMLCAVGERSMDLVIYESLTNQKMLARNPQADFEADGQGFVPGEGCGVLALKRLSDAERDGDKIYSVIRGIGCGANWQQPGDAIRQAITRTWEQTGIGPDDLCMMDVIGSVPDLEEQMLHQVTACCEKRSDSEPLPVSSLVSQFGYMGANHSMAAVIKACLAEDHKKLPAGIVPQNPRPSLFPSSAVQPLQEAKAIDVAGASSIGIVSAMEIGTAYHAIVDTVHKPAPAVSPPQKAQFQSMNLKDDSSVEVIRLGASSWKSLPAALADANAAELFQQRRSFQVQDRARMAFVCQDAAQLQNQIAKASAEFDKLRHELRNRWSAEGIFFGVPRADYCCTGFMFPGLGSQYPGMFHELISSNQAAQSAAEQVQAAFDLLGLGALEELIGSEAVGLGEAVWRTQTSMLVSAWIVEQSLRSRGVRPSVIAGHSFGEYPAITAAGGWSITDAIRAAIHRAEAIEQSAGARGHMVATSAPIEVVEEVLQDIPDAYVANFNSRDQVVLSGSTIAMEQAAQSLTQRKQVAVKLNVPCPFHSPLLQPVAENLMERLQSMPLQETSVPVVSTAQLGEMNTREQFLQSLEKQLVTKVDFPQILNQVLSHRPALLVEVGPKQVLTRLGKRNLPESEVVFMSTDNSQRPGELAIIDIQAQAECLDCLVPGTRAQDPTFRGRRGDAQFIVFDATEKRRERLRAASKGGTAPGKSHSVGSQVRKAKANEGAAPAASPEASVRSNGSVNQYENTHSNGSTTQSSFSTESVSAPATSTQPASPQPASTSSELVVQQTEHTSPVAAASDSTAVAEAEIRQVLIEFVVEQTGYPEEIIELDADLEADLGIDSIKKAQLFGEVGAHFRIAPREDLSLDDFPTLEHVLAFLREELGAGTDSNPVTTQSIESSANGSTTTVEQEIQMPASRIQDSVHDSAPLPAPVAQTPAGVVAPTSGAVAEQEIRQVLIDFVVEQTGYPEEIIELDADLEADLGIDSIKKAQLFGEVGAHFRIAPREDLSLDDFPTLGHVLEFLCLELSASSASSPEPASNPTVGLIESQTPPSSSQTSAETLSHSNGSVSAEPIPSSMETSTSIDDSEIRRVLVDFVVEQTGYPEEIIELDADLEADLGIDSIKKAQLFGEVGAHFQIAPREDLSLDDFPTLGHVLCFLQEELGASAAPMAASEIVSVEVVTSVTSAPVETPVSAPEVTAPIATERNSSGNTQQDVVQVVELYGTADQRGRQYGEMLRDEVQAALARMMDSWSTSATNELVEWPCALNDALVGAAIGASVPQQSVVKLNQQFAPMSNWVCGFSDDTATASGTGAFAVPVAVHVHHEVEQLPYLGIAEVGQIHIRAGVNSAGLAVSCEPLSANTLAEDVVKVTGRLHQILAKSTTLADAKSQLSELAIQGQWCIGLSSPTRRSAEYLSFDGGAREAVPVQQGTEMQRAFHESQTNDSQVIRFVHKQSGGTFTLNLSEYLPQPKRTQGFVEEDQITTVMKRWVLRTTVENLPPANPRSVCAGKRYGVLGEGEFAKACSVAIREQGGTASVHADIDSVMNEFGGEAPEHLILACCGEDLGRQLAGSNPSDEFVQLCADVQKWLITLATQDVSESVTVSAVTRLGGDLGFGGAITDFAGGGLTGFAKALRREHPQLQVKVVDCDASPSPTEAANLLLEELAGGTGDLEVAYRDGQRYVVQAVQQEVPAGDQSAIRAGGVWICTGGGRGVTSVVAREIGRRFQLKLHLFGTAPEPAADARWRGMDQAQLKELKREIAIEARANGLSPIDEWSRIEKAIELDGSLRQFSEEGIDWQYHSCDITNRTELESTLRSIRSEQGPIEGIIHGAGIEAACKFVSKKPENVRRTIASKCDGAALLMELTQNDPLQYFVGFGSTSGRFGGLGQADYSLASDLLAKMTSRLAQERPETHAVCFHWPAWGDVGMAMRPESRMALEASGLAYMPANEGANHLINELLAGAPEREVLLLDQGGILDTDGTMTRTTVPAPLPPSAVPTPPRDEPKRQPRSAASLSIESPNSDTSDLPMIQSFVAGNQPNVFEATCLLDPVNDPFLAQHRFRDRPFLPGVISMEMMAEAAQLLCPDEEFIGFANVHMEKGMAFQDNQAREVRVRVESVADGISCKVIAPFSNSQGDVINEERVYSSAIARFGKPPQIEPINPGTPIFGWSPFYYPEEIVISHGQPMQCLNQLDYKHGGGRARLNSGSIQQVMGDRQPRAMKVASLVLDGSMVCCGFYGFCMLETSVGLPHSIEQYRQVRLPREFETCTLRFFYQSSNEVGDVHDFVVLGEAGDVIMDVKGYQSSLVVDAD